MNYDDLLEKAWKATPTDKWCPTDVTKKYCEYCQHREERPAVLIGYDCLAFTRLEDAEYVFACRPEVIIELVERYKEAVEVLSWIEMDTRDHTAPNRRSNDKVRAFLEKVK